MNEQMLNDLATIAACQLKLIARCRADGADAMVASLSDLCATAVAALCCTLNAPATDVQQRAEAILNGSEATTARAVH